MKRFLINLVGAVAVLEFASVVNGKRFNILSIESGDFSAIIHAMFIDYLEEHAYVVAKRDKTCKLGEDEERDKKIPAYKMFDFIAGSETGAIIASMLSIKNTDTKSGKKNAHYADSAVKFFLEN